MGEKFPILDQERENIAFFEKLPTPDRERVNFANIRGVQFLEPLFEFSGACGGCGETPYLKLVSQLFGDRMQVANATGCSAIYAGNTPAHPWKANADGRGVAWSNSLFEDNAEFGLGYRLAIDAQTRAARALLEGLKPAVGADLVKVLLESRQHTEPEFAAQRARVAALKEKLAAIRVPGRAQLLKPWRIFWCAAAFGSSAATAGPMTSAMAGSTTCSRRAETSMCSCSTPRSIPTPAGSRRKRRRSAPRRNSRQPASARRARTSPCRRFPTAISMWPRSRIGANAEQALIALREAEAYPGASLVLAYCQCIAHGIDMRTGMKQQARAVASGYWPLFRFDPTMRSQGLNPFRLDLPRPRIPLRDYIYRELRYETLTRSHPEDAAEMLRQAQAGVLENYRIYEDLAARDGSRFLPHWEDAPQ